jgi:uncharacterized membrane protein YdjX (TVP38/TMEM64 family)
MCVITVPEPVAGAALGKDVPAGGDPERHAFWTTKCDHWLPIYASQRGPAKRGQLPCLPGVYPAVSKAATNPTFTPLRLVVAAVVVALIAAFFFFRETFNLASLHDRAGEFNGGLVFLGLTVLPLFGFPVSVLHAMAGAKFGLPLGMTLVGVSLAIQLAASYGIVRLAPDFFARRFDWLRRKLPPATHRSLTLFTVLLPGAPFFAQNYTLAVVGVPFRIFFSYCFPINFCRSLIGVIFGEWSGNMTPLRITIIGIYAVAITVTCGLAFRRLRAQLKNQPRAVGGRKPRA